MEIAHLDGLKCGGFPGLFVKHMNGKKCKMNEKGLTENFGCLAELLLFRLPGCDFAVDFVVSSL